MEELVPGKSNQRKSPTALIYSKVSERKGFDEKQYRNEKSQNLSVSLSWSYGLTTKLNVTSIGKFHGPMQVSPHRSNHISISLAVFAGLT